MKSIGGSCPQSTSPAARGPGASQGSAICFQTTLSRYALLPPADPLGASLRGMYSLFRRYSTCSPGFQSSLANLNGPEPIISLIRASGGVAAILAGIMNGTLLP